MDKIIDIHTHILPGVDDGAKDITVSKQILEKLEKQGFEGIFLTSHYIENTNYNANEKERKKVFDKLQKETKLKLYLGNEVFINENLIHLHKNKAISTLNGSRYMLVELPLNGYNYQTTQIICDLTSNNIVPIIAHPERYLIFQDDYNQINELLDYGCLLQCNVGSLIGKYGKKAKKLMKYLLKNDLVTFIGSDIHSVKDAEDILNAYKKLKKKVGDQKYQKLTYENPMKIIENKEI